jgi:hypothetical protein
MYVTLNSRDCVFFTEKSDNIIKTDFNFQFIKQFGSKGSGKRAIELSTWNRIL